MILTLGMFVILASAGVVWFLQRFGWAILGLVFLTGLLFSLQGEYWMGILIIGMVAPWCMIVVACIGPAAKQEKKMKPKLEPTERTVHSPHRSQAAHIRH